MPHATCKSGSLLLLLCAAGCDLTGEQSTTRLLLYASPRGVSTDGRHIALIGVEAVQQCDGLYTDDCDVNATVPMCVRLSAQLGSFDSPVNRSPQSYGGVACVGNQCVFLSLPGGRLRRNFATYRSSAVDDNDVLLGDLYELTANDACPPAHFPQATATGFLTLQVPDVVLPSTTDLSVAVDLAIEDGNNEGEDL